MRGPGSRFCRDGPPSLTIALPSRAGKRGNSGEMDMDVDTACGPLKRHRSSGSEDLDPPALSSSFAVPHLPAKRSPTSAPLRSISAPLTSSQPVEPAQPGPSSTAVWAGPVFQASASGRDLLFCNMSVPLPADCAAELNETAGMEVSQLAPRRGVKVRRHRVCKCTLLDPSASQLVKLRSMAQNELVALAPLQRHGLILVPYLDNQGAVKLVCFCLALHR
jgi:hypothetical protein